MSPILALSAKILGAIRWITWALGVIGGPRGVSRPTTGSVSARRGPPALPEAGEKESVLRPRFCRKLLFSLWVQLG